MSKIHHLWRNYNLSIVLFALFAVSWVLQSVMGWVQFVSEQEAHGEIAEIFGSSGYFWRWGEATFENWQSEFLQLLTFVVLTSFLIHRGSHESKDADEQMQAQLNRIEQKLATLAGESGIAGVGSHARGSSRSGSGRPAA